MTMTAALRARMDHAAAEALREQAWGRAPAADVSQPEAGFFRFRLRGGGVICGVEIRFGAPLDPVTGEELDRSPRWMAFIDGDYFDDFLRIWPACTGSPISAADYRALVARRLWARENAPDSAYADPHRRIDPLSTNTPTQF